LSPGGVGGELVLDVGGNSGGDLHRENSIDQPGPKSTDFCNFFRGFQRITHNLVTLITT
jgi:hypothetical protein